MYLSNNSSLHWRDAYDRTAKFCAGFEGTSVDKLGAIKIQNEIGGRTPFIWVFNEANEVRALSQALGTDQPFYSLRSLNKIMPPSEERNKLSKRLSEEYANILSPLLPKEVPLVGGNCQGADFAFHVANKLKEIGHKVGYIATIDATPETATDIPILFQYGDFGASRNPFQSNPEKTYKRARNTYSEFSIVELPSSHGTYFLEPNIQHLTKNLENLLNY